MFSSSHNIYNTHNLSHRVSHEQFSSQHNSTMLDAIQQPNLTHFGGPRSFTSISHIGQTSLRCANYFLKTKHSPSVFLLTHYTFRL